MEVVYQTPESDKFISRVKFEEEKTKRIQALSDALNAPGLDRLDRLNITSWIKELMDSKYEK